MTPALDRKTLDAARAERRARQKPRSGRLNDWRGAERDIEMVGAMPGWRFGAPKLFTFTRFPKGQWKSIRTSNAIVVRQTPP